MFPSKVRTLVKTTNSPEFPAGWHDNQPVNVLPPATHFHAELLIYAGISLLFTVKDSDYLFFPN